MTHRGNDLPIDANRLIAVCADGCVLDGEEHDCCAREHLYCDGQGCSGCHRGLMWLPGQGKTKIEVTEDVQADTYVEKGQPTMRTQVSVTGMHGLNVPDFTWPDNWATPHVGDPVQVGEYTLYVRVVHWYPMSDDETAEPFVYLVLGPNRP